MMLNTCTVKHFSKLKIFKIVITIRRDYKLPYLLNIPTVCLSVLDSVHIELWDIFVYKSLGKIHTAEPVSSAIIMFLDKQITVAKWQCLSLTSAVCSELQMPHIAHYSLLTVRTDHSPLPRHVFSKLSVSLLPEVPLIFYTSLHTWALHARSEEITSATSRVFYTKNWVTCEHENIVQNELWLEFLYSSETIYVWLLLDILGILGKCTSSLLSCTSSFGHTALQSLYYTSVFFFGRIKKCGVQRGF